MIKTKPITGNKTNNNINKLEWMTDGENHAHAYSVLKRKPSRQGLFGKSNPSSKPVNQLKNNILVKTYASVADASLQTGISASLISEVANGKWLLGKGFGWQFCPR